MSFVNNGFSPFFELLDNLPTRTTWLSEEDPTELHQPPPRGSFKHSMGTEGLDKLNNLK